MRTLFRSERGATDPILVIAAVAVSLVLLVGGSFTVSGIVQSAKDTAAKQMLDFVASAEAGVSARLTDTQANAPYLSWSVLADGSTSGSRDDEGSLLQDSSVGFTPTAGVPVAVNGNAQSWVAAVRSQTGKLFFRSSKAAAVYEGSIPSSAYDTTLTYPAPGTPYNPGAACPATTGNTVSGYDTSPDVMTVVDDNTVRLTFTATGTALCRWYNTAKVNLGGDHITGTSTSSLTVKPSGSSSYQGGSLKTVTLDIVAAGDALSATRTVTLTFTPYTWSPYTSASDQASKWGPEGFAWIFSGPGNGYTLMYQHKVVAA